MLYHMFFFFNVDIFVFKIEPSMEVINKMSFLKYLVSEPFGSNIVELSTLLRLILSEHIKCDFSWSILLVQSSFNGSPVMIWLHVSGVPPPSLTDQDIYVKSYYSSFSHTM